MIPINATLVSILPPVYYPGLQPEILLRHLPICHSALLVKRVSFHSYNFSMKQKRKSGQQPDFRVLKKHLCPRTHMSLISAMSLPSPSESSLGSVQCVCTIQIWQQDEPSAASVRADPISSYKKNIIIFMLEQSIFSPNDALIIGHCFKSHLRSWFPIL